MLSANKCQGFHPITNAATISPMEGGITGDLFSVTCMEGFSLIPDLITSDRMICNGHEWENMPQCHGKISKLPE